MNLTLPWQQHFDRHVFSKSLIFVPLLMKINFNAIITLLVIYQLFIEFENFSGILGSCLILWKNFEIQDGRSKMAAVLTS